MKTRARWRRPAAWLAAASACAVLVLLVLPEGHLACHGSVWDRSPDGAWTLSVCPRPMMMAMPGQGGDAPAWIVLRDAQGFIRGVSALDMIQDYDASGEPTSWDPLQVTIPLTLDMPLPPAHGRMRVWLEDRVWRLRALLGLTTSSEDFH